MSYFQELTYFKPIILNELELYSSITDDKLKEIYLRNIVSRLYYTAMHLCIEKLNIQIDPNERTHEQVLNALPRGIKQRLKSLKKLREKADYKDHPFHFPLSTKGRAGVFLNSIKNIQDTLEFFETLNLSYNN